MFFDESLRHRVIEDIHNVGFSKLAGYLNETDMQFARNDAEVALLKCNDAARGNKREWAPLNNEPEALITSFLLRSDADRLAAEILDAPVVGVIADAYRIGGDTDIHADADGFPALRGVRFNFYLTDGHDERGALRFVKPGFTRSCCTETSTAAPSSAGDVLVFDLSTPHFVTQTVEPRLFSSVIYYAQPHSESEKTDFYLSMQRNLKAERIFLSEPYNRLVSNWKSYAAERPEWGKIYSSLNLIS